MQRFGPLLLRLCVGSVFLAHGAQKLFGLWGGAGIAGTARMIASLGLPYPMPLAVLLAVVEFGGGVLLILGGAIMWVSLALIVDMGIAVWKVHYAHGFFLNWLVVPGHGHGFEYNLVLIAALVSLMLSGPGALSVDERRSQKAEAQARGRARIRKV
jgi:putative oxidoreductase